MSVTVSKADGVTVFTLTSDPDSAWPPLCQIFKNLCYSPVCCTVSQHLRKIQRASQTVLGTLQIIVGLLNIGLAAILLSTHSQLWQMEFTGFPFWLGGLFIMFGIVSILSERFPSPCLVVVNVILNLVGVAFAITAIVLYSISVADIYMWGMCERNDYWYDRHTTPSPSVEEAILQRKCLEGKAMLLMLMRGMHAVLIVLSVLELCVVISSVVLGIKSLRSKEKGQNKSTDDPELYSPLLQEVSTKPSV
ncbi:high affinity immunoglobulin epsilon receptor subunit beta-like [Archocentrus centrarchus]|uniref:high affinity immunoglobulin epsilon receptor subunit beta-like n=1 Tax=Archocentrus centrarchus TaxID=63155 RepID=UPI0011E9C6DC|nr:high affinity immunoglobulin epsilon receptor subunit beta-like [Archocentrus centrarchus]